jgi:hypothetical protein
LIFIKWSNALSVFTNQIKLINITSHIVFVANLLKIRYFYIISLKNFIHTNLTVVWRYSVILRIIWINISTQFLHLTIVIIIRRFLQLDHLRKLFKSSQILSLIWIRLLLFEIIYFKINYKLFSNWFSFR